ncbi:MAG: DUF2889 domain-containing protein [Alphaproteobacteria bacterium]|nr:DUF2889 domain-containing protein [Alphaproteobacteria bacterium]
MPLSPPVEREHLHTRHVECRGFQRKDGLWDVEGHLVDTKTYGFDNQWRGRMEPGTPIHQMWLRVTVDHDMKIHAIEAVTDDSPYKLCADITPEFQKLVGMRMVAGFNARLREMLGGTKGCTHLVELMGPVATAAYQTVFTARGGGKWRDPAPGPKKKPRFLDTCHALASDSEVVRRFWPEFYKGRDADKRDAS